MSHSHTNLKLHDEMKKNVESLRPTRRSLASLRSIWLNESTRTIEFWYWNSIWTKNIDPIYLPTSWELSCTWSSGELNWYLWSIEPYHNQNIVLLQNMPFIILEARGNSLYLKRVLTCLKSLIMTFWMISNTFLYMYTYY